MINTKYKDGKLINPDFIKPEMVYATFNQELCDRTKKEIALQLDIGGKMIQSASNYSGTAGNLRDILVFMEEIEELYCEYDSTRFDIIRGE